MENKTHQCCFISLYMALRHLVLGKCNFATRWGENDIDDDEKSEQVLAYLIFVIFFTRAKFLDNEIYTEKRQLFALNL